MLDNATHSGSKLPVLVVDDEVLIRMMIADELRENGLPVIECGDADEALEVLQCGAPVSLVITDVRMPGSMDGAGLASVIKRDYPQLKVVLTSSEQPPAGVIFDHFIGKPWDFPSAVQHIKSIVGA